MSERLAAQGKTLRGLWPQPLFQNHISNKIEKYCGRNPAPPWMVENVFHPYKKQGKTGKNPPINHEISQFPYSSSEVKITARKGVLARPTLRHGTGADCCRKWRVASWAPSAKLRSFIQASSRCQNVSRMAREHVWFSEFQRIYENFIYFLGVSMDRFDWENLFSRWCPCLWGCIFHGHIWLAEGNQARSQNIVNT